MGSLLESPNQVLLIAEDLGYGPEVRLRQLLVNPKEYFDESTGKSLGDWELHLIGTPIAEPPPEKRHFNYDGQCYGLLLKRVRRPGQLWFLEERVLRNGRMKESVEAIQTVKRTADLRRLIKDIALGRRLIHRDIPNAGKPVGSGVPITQEDVAREYWAYVKENQGKRPSQETLSERFFLSPRQFKTRLREDRIKWPPSRLSE
jgi:hypothetical protein